MKRALALLSVTVLVLVSCTRSGSSGAIAWKSDYAAALAEAKAQNKPVFMDFYADW